MPGQSGNPAGRPKGERRYLVEQYGEAGECLFSVLHRLAHDPKTPVRQRIHVLMFLVERLHGRAQQRVEVSGTDGGPVVFEVITAVPAPEASRG